MEITVVGVGYVGLVVGTCLSDFGLNVTCVDNDEDKIKILKKGLVPIYEIGLNDLIRRNVDRGRLHFSDNLAEAVEKCSVVFIAVGTPPRDDGWTDLSAFHQVCKGIGAAMNGYKVVIIKSTVPVGTARSAAEVIRASQDRPLDFDIVSNPEFLREGSAVEDFMRPDRVVIGTGSRRAIKVMKEMYRPLELIDTPILVTTNETAEMIKYASNSLLATKVSFINEIANICERVGADVEEVAKGIGLDRRIGPRFLSPGPGYGGSCFPKDLQALIHIARQIDYDFKIGAAAEEVNRLQKLSIVEKTERLVGDLQGAEIGILGLAFKPNTDDVREAPSLTIIPGLQEKGARIRAYDPIASKEAAKQLNDIIYVKDVYAAAEGVDCLVVVTDWNEFRELDLQRLKTLMRRPNVVDGRNLYSPARMRELGFNYVGVGRQPVNSTEILPGSEHS
jgi:UDPglucose 6-dehydrogenase